MERVKLGAPANEKPGSAVREKECSATVPACYLYSAAYTKVAKN
jgi:hypothetical protein